METDTATYRTAHTGDPTAALHADSSVSADATGFSPHLRLLGLDAHGRALDWLSWQDAVRMTQCGSGSGMDRA